MLKQMSKYFLTAIICTAAFQAHAHSGTIYQCGIAKVEYFDDENRAQISYDDVNLTTISDGMANYLNSFHNIEFNFRYDDSTLHIANEKFECKRISLKSPDGRTAFTNLKGMSLGGSLREGPGVNFAKAGSLRYGADFTINANSGVEFNGYDWFEVSQGREISYQWGGIMCSNGQKIKGIFEQCPKRATYNDTGPYLALALASDGTFGYAAATRKDQAESLALQNCRQPSCKIDITTTAKCLGYAIDTDGDPWYGSSTNKKDAEEIAMGHCYNSGKGCRLTASVCIP